MPMTSPIEGFMHDIKADEVSLVKRPANKREFLLTKSDNGEKMDELLRVVMETEADNEADLVTALKSSGLSDKTIEAAKSVARLINAYSDELDVNAFRSIGESLGFEVDAGDNGEADTKLSKSDLDKLPEEVKEKVSALEKSRKEASERIQALEDRLQKAEDERRLNAFVEKARELTGINRKPEDVAKLLKSVADTVGDEAANDILETLRSADAAVRESKLFDEYGSGAPGIVGESVLDEVDALAKARMEKSDITLAEARDRVLQENSELARRYLREAQGR